MVADKRNSIANGDTAASRASAKDADVYGGARVWVAERVGTEALRDRLRNQVLMPLRSWWTAADLRIGAEELGVRRRDELLSRREAGGWQQSGQ